MNYWFLFFALLFAGCSFSEKKTHKLHVSGEYIYRLHNEYFFTPPPPCPQMREKYPWEDKYIRNLPSITKQFFRCKGNHLNPVIIQPREGKESIKYYDCQGGTKHGLPIREGKEFIYPCLIELLNYIQLKTGKRVCITCGHRCPKHNAYADQTPLNWSSKHMIGAEVDFYVEGMEQKPMTIVALLQQYYQETSSFSQNKEYTNFYRYEKEKLNVSTLPWYNKEIFIKLYLENEGRDIDNQHSYPYISIQVRNDRDTDTKVIFEQKAAQNYLRH